MYLWKGNRFHSGFTTLLPSVDGHSNSSKVPTKSLHTISSSFSFTFRKLLALTKWSDQPFAKLSCSQHSQVRFITYYYVSQTIIDYRTGQFVSRSLFLPSISSLYPTSCDFDPVVFTYVVWITLSSAFLFSTTP